MRQPNTFAAVQAVEKVEPKNPVRVWLFAAVQAVEKSVEFPAIVLMTFAAVRGRVVSGV